MDAPVMQLGTLLCLIAMLVMLITTRRRTEKTYPWEKTPTINWVAVLATIAVMAAAMFLAGRDIAIPEIDLGVDIPYPALIVLGAILGGAMGFVGGALGGWAQSRVPWPSLSVTWFRHGLSCWAHC